MMISQAAVDLIVAAEVSSRAVYERKYTHPEWPGESSGITIAIGYDVGYADAEKLRSDWKARIPDEMIAALTPCCGVHGQAAAGLLPRVRDKVTVPWQPAMAVFLEEDVPAFTAKVCREIPSADRLSPDCLGALVSLSYNRGSFLDTGERRTEMRAIRAMIMNGKLDGVSDQIRAMKRLWPNSRGLRDRRDAEAAMWDRGLKQPVAISVPKPKPTENPPPLTPPAKPGAGEGTTAGGTVLTGGAAASKAAHSGASSKVVVTIIVVAIVAAIALAVGMYLWRSRPVTARAKG